MLVQTSKETQKKDNKTNDNKKKDKKKNDNKKEGRKKVAKKWQLNHLQVRNKKRMQPKDTR